MVRAARACRAGGARRVVCAAAHGLFIEGARGLIEENAVDRILVTDSVPPFRLEPEVSTGRVHVVSSAGLFAEAVRRIHEGDSVVDLLEHGDRAAHPGP